MRTSSKMSVKEIEESKNTWEVLDDVLKRIKKLKPGKVPSLPEMEHLLKELRKGKRKGGLVSRKRGGGIGLTKKDVETRKPTPTLTKDEQLENKKLRELHKRGRALYFRLNKPSSTTKYKRNGGMAYVKGKKEKKVEHWTGMKVPPRTGATELGGLDARAELRHRAQALANAKTDKARNTALNRLRSSLSSFEEMKEKSPTGKSMGYKARITRKGGGTVKRKSGGKIMQGYKAGGKV